MKKTICLVLTLCTLAILVLTASVPVMATGSSKWDATKIEFDKEYKDEIEVENGEDWYCFNTVPESAYYYLTIENESIDNNLIVKVISSRDKEVKYDVISRGNTSTMNVKLDSNEIYYVRIYASYNNTGFYSIKNVSYKVDKEPDDKSSALKIDVNQLYKGELSGDGDVDCISFTVPNHGEYAFELTNENIKHTIAKIYTSRDKELIASYANSGKTTKNVCTFESNDTYYIKVTSAYGDTGNYSLKIIQCVNGHTPAEAWTTTKEPTCTEVGERVKYCSVCGEVIETDQIKAKGHTFEDWKVTKPATWHSLGEKESACKDCGEIKIKKDWSKVWIIPVAVVVIALAVFVLIIVIGGLSRAASNVAVNRASANAREVKGVIAEIEKAEAKFNKTVKLAALISFCSDEKNIFDRSGFDRKQKEISDGLKKAKKDLRKK